MFWQGEAVSERESHGDDARRLDADEAIRPSLEGTAAGPTESAAAAASVEDDDVSLADLWNARKSAALSATSTGFERVRDKADDIRESSSTADLGYHIGHAAWRSRIWGLSAEAAFWGTFTLPWVILGVLSAMGSISRAFGSDVTEDVVDQVLQTARSLLTEQTVEDFLVPLIDQVLSGSTSLSVVGFVVAIWSGSRVVSTLVEAGQIINGGRRRSWLKTRSLGLVIYLIGIIVIVLLAVGIVALPDVVLDRGGRFEAIFGVGMPTLLFVALVVLMATLQWIANPRRRQWRFTLPGAVLSVLVWWAGSFAMRYYLAWILREGSVYGAIIAPIAVMLWIFVTALAVMLGMVLNSARIDWARARIETGPSDDDLE